MLLAGCRLLNAMSVEHTASSCVHVITDQCGVLQCPSLDKRARPSDTVRQAQCFAVLRQCFGNADGSSSRAAVEAMGTCVEVLTRPHLTPLN